MFLAFIWVKHYFSFILWKNLKSPDKLLELGRWLGWSGAWFASMRTYREQRKQAWGCVLMIAAGEVGAGLCLSGVSQTQANEEACLKQVTLRVDTDTFCLTPPTPPSSLSHSLLPSPLPLCLPFPFSLFSTLHVPTHMCTCTQMHKLKSLMSLLWMAHAWLSSLIVCSALGTGWTSSTRKLGARIVFRPQWLNPDTQNISRPKVKCRTLKHFRFWIFRVEILSLHEILSY